MLPSLPLPVPDSGNGSAMAELWPWRACSVHVLVRGILEPRRLGIATRVPCVMCVREKKQKGPVFLLPKQGRRWRRDGEAKALRAEEVGLALTDSGVEARMVVWCRGGAVSTGRSAAPIPSQGSDDGVSLVSGVSHGAGPSPSSPSFLSPPGGVRLA